MNAPPFVPPAEGGTPGLAPNDAEHLRMLSLGFRIHGGLVAACGGAYALLFPLWLNMVTSASRPGSGKVPPTPFPTAFFSAFVGIFVVFTLVLAGLSFLAASRIDRRIGHTLVVVVSVLSLLMQPLGTILGVLALVVLFRPSVKAAFALT